MAVSGVFHDLLRSLSTRRVEYSLMRYVPAHLLLVHLLAAQAEKPTLQVCGCIVCVVG
jgi:hypothetical protein